MLSIQPPSSSKPQKCTPNLLPARIHHDGPITDPHRYWTPEKHEDGTLHAYFRGRHLHGTTLALPAGYTGAAVKVTDKLASRDYGASGRREEGGEDDGDEEEEEAGDGEVVVAERVGQFEEVVVWGHGGTVDERGDVYVRGLREWIGFAEAAHVEEEEAEGEGEGEGEAKKGGKKD